MRVFHRLLESHFDLEEEETDKKRQHFRGIRKKVENINKALKHKPFRPDSDEYRAFLKKQLEEMEKLEMMHQWIDYRLEKEEVLKRLSGEGGNEK